MAFEEFGFVSLDGLKLQGFSQSPSNDQVSAIICIVHGIGEHSGRYKDMAEYLSKFGIAVYAFDMRGHGKSDGLKGHAKYYHYLLDDIEEMMKYARSEHFDAPMFLYGHGIGGNQVVNYVLNRNTSELKGAILSSPWFELGEDGPEFKTWLAGITNKILPFTTHTVSLKAEHRSRDQETIADDPMLQNKISSRMLIRTIEAGQNAIKNASQLKMPILIIQGAENKIVSIDAIKSFGQNAPKGLVKLKVYEQLKHEVHTDPEMKGVLNDMMEWIKKI